MHFNKIRKQYAWGELGKEMNRPVDECKKKMENSLSSIRREKNEDEEKQCNRKR